MTRAKERATAAAQEVWRHEEGLKSVLKTVASRDERM
jgi:hypothetical protein